MTLDWLHVIALLGAIQGVFLASVLALRRRNRTANRILAALVVAFSLHLASAVYHGAGLVEALPHFFGVGHPMPFLYGPLVYLYALTVADRSRRFTGRDALHLIPFLAVVVTGIPIYMMSGAEKVAFFQQLQRGDRPLLIAVSDPLKLVSGVTYAVLTVHFLVRHREQVKESYSSTERVNLQWLLWLGAAAASIWLLAVVFEVLGLAGGHRFARSDDVISLAIAVLVYAIGYKGLRQPEIFRYETAEYPIPRQARSAAPETAVVHLPEPEVAARAEPREAPATPALGEEPEPESAAPRYERSGLSEREARRLKEALATVMERDRPWQDSELTLADLADRLSTTPHKLSEVLNSQLGQSFYDFVNGYRVREVQRRIAAGEAQRLRMLTLALDAGFASKSTFNQAFKKHTNQTPSDYRQAVGM